MKNKAISEKIIMKINKLANDAKKMEKSEGTDKKPESPMGPPPEIRTLVLLKSAGKELKRPEIGMILGLPPKANDESIDRLAADGFVSVREDNPNDKKKNFVSITEAGLEKMEKDKEEKRKKADAFLANLTEEEKETLLTLLEKIKK